MLLNPSTLRGGHGILIIVTPKLTPLASKESADSGPAAQDASVSNLDSAMFVNLFTMNKKIEAFSLKPAKSEKKGMLARRTMPVSVCASGSATTDTACCGPGHFIRTGIVFCANPPATVSLGLASESEDTKIESSDPALWTCSEHPPSQSKREVVLANSVDNQETEEQQVTVAIDLVPKRKRRLRHWRSLLL